MAESFTTVFDVSQGKSRSFEENVYVIGRRLGLILDYFIYELRKQLSKSGSVRNKAVLCQLDHPKQCTHCIKIFVLS